MPDSLHKPVQGKCPDLEFLVPALGCQRFNALGKGFVIVQSSLIQFVIHLSSLELDGEENDKVLGEGENDKDDAQPNPENEGADSLRPEEHHFGLIDIEGQIYGLRQR